MLSPFADAVVAPARPILDRIAAHGPVPRPTVIPHGIDVERFAHPTVPLPSGNLPWPSTARVIGYVGRYDPVKNLPTLLRAFAILRSQSGTADLHLALLGYGPQEQTLRRLAHSLHIAPHTHFLAPTPHPERYYKHFDGLCLPSTEEGFGLIFLEAMAAGVPVLGMDTPVSRSIVRPEIDGLLLAPPLTAERLATALQSLMKFSKAAPPSAPFPPTPPPPVSLSPPHYVQQHFSLARMADRHAEFFRKILTSP
jgi:glycosyltransferase involved in cell wall biosynthesis